MQWSNHRDDRMVRAQLHRLPAADDVAPDGEHPAVEIADDLRVAFGWRRFFRQAAAEVGALEEPAYRRWNY